MVEDGKRFSRRTLGVGAAGVAVASVGVTIALVGEGIDPSGTRDSTRAIQDRIRAAAPGAVIAIPAGSVLRCDDTVVLSAEGATLAGPGELRFTGGGTGTAVRVTGRGCRLDQVVVTDPEGRYSRGIEIAADDVTVHDCVVKGFEYGVVVAAEGEWVDTRILGNRVLDVRGAGGGRGSDSRDGEDRGDGITVWGARAVVAGNIVTAAPGTDARIGIHGEGLGDVKERDVAHADAMVTITGNVVSGPFRRCIVLEEIDDGVIAGNTVADATWWGIALIAGVGCVVTGNTVRYTRSAEDDQGRVYSPPRSPLVVYGGEGHTVADNSVTVLGVAEAYVTLVTLTDVDRPTDVTVSGNNCRTAGDGSCVSGVVLEGDEGPLRPKILDNTFGGVTGIGVYLGRSTGPEVRGNTVVAGEGGAEHGIMAEHPEGSPALVVANRVRGCRIGIGLSGQTSGVVTANVMEDCGTGIDLFESDGVVLVGNLAVGSGTAVDNAGGNQVVP